MAPTVSFSNMDEEGPSSAVHKDTKRRRRVNPIDIQNDTFFLKQNLFYEAASESGLKNCWKELVLLGSILLVCSKRTGKGVASRNRNRKAALFADSTDKLTTFKDLHGKGKMETVKSTEKRIKSISERRSQINHQQGREKEVQCESHLMSPEHSNFHPKTIKIESPDTVNASGSDLLHASLPKLKANRRKYYKPHPCPICGKLFTSKQDLIRHDRTHSGERPFHCTECKKSFTLRHHLTGHQRTHTDEKPYQCSKCNKTFTSIRNLEKHQKSHTETYKTTHCVVTPVGMSSLACYDRTDSGERPFHCIACKKSFSLRHHLIGHQRTHTGEKPYQCTKCDKTFSLIGNLGKHQKTHTVAYKPTHLGKVIPVRKSSIAWPDRTHSGERPFHCTECKKSFTLKHHLIGHQRTHTGEKPYQCSECNKTFSLIGNLAKHKRTHTRAYKTTYHGEVIPVRKSTWKATKKPP